MSTIEIDKVAFHSRVQRLYDNWRNAAEDNDYRALVGADAILLAAGDPPPEDEPERQGSLIQFPSTFILFEEHQILILCSYSKARILSQLEDFSGGVPLRILQTANRGEPDNGAIHRFFATYASKKRVGILREVHRGPLIDEGLIFLGDAAQTPRLVDMGPAFSALMATDGLEG
ncbi:FACT complex subunit Spt16, N-terminal lobe domain-containing protein [Mycena sanguinolenta]|nr:FACT complex subunit Spt16, N-terminal lobe domain-containing protein [Mycena sanguinolenta]